ncbi:unnamed protein product, partial [Brassica oleracea var. botrytis]
VLCYCLFKELRKFSFKLVFYLPLSDMICSFFLILGTFQRQRISLHMMAGVKASAFSVKGVRELIKPSSNRKVMEYVQSSKFSSCQVP